MWQNTLTDIPRLHKIRQEPQSKNGIIGDTLANGVIISNCNNICVIPQSKLYWTSY